MKKIGIGLVIIFILLSGLLAITIVNEYLQSLPAGRQAKKAVILPPKSNEEGEVVVDVTPVAVKKGEKVVFDVKLDTHNIELDYDLVAKSQLTDNKGNIYQALSWNGGKGGHHLSGKLTFPSLAKEATSLTLAIKNIDNIDRVFRWEL